MVDDSLQLRRSIMYALQRVGPIECVEAADGADAFRLYLSGDFDVVLTDVNMPVLDGLKLISLIRQSKNNAVPIIVITTESRDEDRERAMKLGANAYLIKPVKAPEVVAAIQELLPQARPL